jgi:hypothetical protein
MSVVRRHGMVSAVAGAALWAGKNVSPAANEQGLEIRRQAADDVVALPGATSDRPAGHLCCQTGASLPTVTAPRSRDARGPPN